jgi:uncharacterized protein (DUF488 family)
MPQANRLKLPALPAKQQAENRLLWNDSRSLEHADFFTIGYTGRKLDEITLALVEAGVRCLIDIRQFPVSMYRPELSKNNLQEHLENNGIHYLHCPDLGVPRDIRAKAIETGTRDVIWEWYDAIVVEPFIGNNLHRFFNCAEHPVALMCVEIDPRECHRHRLFMALESKGLRGFDL